MSFLAIFSDPSEIDDPFRWKPKENLEAVPEDMIDRLTLKIEEKSLEEEIEFDSIILYLAVSYEHFEAGNVEKSREILRNMVEETTRLGKNENGDVRGRLLALEHLLLSALTRVSIYLKEEEIARKEFNQITPISSMDAKSKAALCGYRATFYSEYGIYGSKAAIAFATKAVEMDPEESLWYFVKGKLFGRVRRVEKPFDIPSPDELEALETAFEKESTAAYAIFTAQVYRETAFRVFRKHRDEGSLYPNLKEIIDKMNAKSYELYEKSLSLKPYCSHVKFRCAKGFMAFPLPFKNTDLAKKCILEGLKMTPTSAYGNHIMAMFYERYEKDVHSAIRYLKICVPLRVFGACVDLLRLEFFHHRLNKKDVLQRLNELYGTFVETPRKCQILSQFVSYYLFVDYVLEEAIKYLVEVFRLNLSCDDIHKHRSLFLKLRFTISLLEVVVDETKVQLSDENCSSQMRAVCNKFLSELAELNVSYSRNRPRHLRQSLLRNNSSLGGAWSGDRGGRQFRKGVARGSSSLNATMSYQRRRNQQVFVDQTLKKIDDFTNSWKKELRLRPPADSGAETRSKVGRPAEEDTDSRSSSEDDDGDGDPRTDSHVRRLAEIRSERCPPPPPPKKSDPQRPSFSRQQPFDQDTLRSLAGLTVSPADECDSDFEKSVLAYRRAKQEADSARSFGEERRSSKSRIKSRSVVPSDQVRSSSSTANTNLAASNTPRSKMKMDGHDTFDNYIARSTAELNEKFEPPEIRF